uniref:MHC class I-like antigen recognition-like domain-containing protein n=1 Tax=Chelydra serpentina TaxID=8475 RepID=A0A8C3SIR9_CHESE
MLHPPIPSYPLPLLNPLQPCPHFSSYPTISFSPVGPFCEPFPGSPSHRGAPEGWRHLVGSDSSLPPTPSSGLHSRRILDTMVAEPGPGLPWFSRVVYVDDQVILYYTSEMEKVEPRPVWMAQNKDPEFWAEMTWWAQRHQKWYNESLNTLKQLYNRTEG